MPTQLAPSRTRAAHAETPGSTPRISPRGSVIALTAVTALATVMAALAATPFGGLVLKPAVHLISSPGASRAHARTTTAGHSAKIAAPKAATSGSASTSSASKAASSSASATSTSSAHPWTKRDSSTLTASTALYYIAGTIYGDPPANHFGVTDMTNATMTPLLRGPSSAATLTQMAQAVKAAGGVSVTTHGKKGGGKLRFELPRGTSVDIDTFGWVKIDGKDALGLKQTSSGAWTSTASGPQVRAFLAGYIEGEGSAKGMIGDDPSSKHLMLLKHLMLTPQAYHVPTTLVGSKYFRLFVASAAYYPRVQAYPFITYSRCPGGKPKG